MAERPRRGGPALNKVIIAVIVLVAVTLVTAAALSSLPNLSNPSSASSTLTINVHNFVNESLFEYSVVVDDHMIESGVFRYWGETVDCQYEVFFSSESDPPKYIEVMVMGNSTGDAVLGYQFVIVEPGQDQTIDISASYE